MKSETPTIKIALCGHIDHGKSTLIGRLLLDTQSLPDDKIKELKKISRDLGEETQIAYFSDQLKEERERDITIETTQIFLKTRKRPYGLIDTPGHLEFIKNMLTGASHADAALLLVDITEGIKEQTRRHAYLLNLLSLKNIIVLVNKMDLAAYDAMKFDRIKNELLNLFTGLGLKPLHIIPVSAKHGENICRSSRKMVWYRGPWLSKAMDNLPLTESRTASGIFRLPIQDIYEINNEKIIIGKIAAGTVREGQKIFILPQAVSATVKAIKFFGKKKITATAPESIGLTLTSDITVHRGDILCAEGDIPRLTQSFKGNIVWLSPASFAKGQTVQLRCATQTFPCAVSQITERIDPATLAVLERTASSLKQNESGIVEFQILGPAVVENYDTVPELGRYTIENDIELLGAGTVSQKSDRT